MKHYNKNGIDILLKKTPKTPRISVCMFFKVNKKEKYYGVNSLLARLLLQGTKRYNAIQLNNEFENECNDISIKAKQDYIKASLVFLNEDFKKAIELLKELLVNSTFDDFDKEKFKIKGEIASDLDSPKLKMVDSFIKTIFKEHPYSSTHTKILEDIDKITKEDVIEAHKTMMSSSKTVVVVGDYLSDEQMLENLANEFSFLTTEEQKDEIENIFKSNIKEDEFVWISKNDAAQAQIIQGWLVNSFNNTDYPKIAVLNNILGSSGLSS
ncbi:MAG: insulinase family protein, partial [Candidatus Gastranaerophilales bacterium]|nr:insulinase family protein [Candidatus Gastranaerophilales bacterium]